MAVDKQLNALQVIFSFFLGMMVVAFIGVGVNTFYEQPFARYQDQIDELYREQEDITIGKGTEDLTPAEERELDRIQDEIRALEDEREASNSEWARNTSIILILFATLVMGVSLVRSEELRIISNGLLLGGLFTMIYGVGWVIASSSSVARFAVMSFALVVTFALGYARFVRGREARAAAPAAAGTGGAVVSDETLAALQGRVEALERRAAAAAKALAREDEAD